MPSSANLVELELKIASLEDQLRSHHSVMQDILAQLHKLDLELKGKSDAALPAQCE